MDEDTIVILLAIAVVATGTIVGIIVRAVKRRRRRKDSYERHSQRHENKRAKIDRSSDPFGFEGTTKPPAESIFGDVAASVPPDKQSEEEQFEKRAKFCSQCGAPVEDDEKFCASCGAKLN